MFHCITSILSSRVIVIPAEYHMGCTDLHKERVWSGYSTFMCQLVVNYWVMYDLRVIVAVVVIHQLDIWTCTAQNCSESFMLCFDDAVITFIS